MKRKTHLSQFLKPTTVMTEIEVSMYRMIADFFGVDPTTITPETHFQNDIGADKMDILKLMHLVHDEFQIEIPDEEMEDIQTVQDAIQYIIMHKPA